MIDSTSDFLKSWSLGGSIVGLPINEGTPESGELTIPDERDGKLKNRQGTRYL